MKTPILLAAGTLFLLAFAQVQAIPFAQKTQSVPAEVLVAGTDEYAVLVAPDYKKDAAAMRAIKHFAKRHNATKNIYVWDDSPALLKKLKKQQPRYIAVIAPPQDLNRVSLQKLNQLSRKIDPAEDAHIDAILGVLTADSVENLEQVLKPFPRIELTRAIGTTNFETERFDQAFIMLDWGGTQKYYTRKNGKTELKELPNPEIAIDIFCDEYNAINPQYFLSASHATEFNLEMPFSHGMIVPAKGKFWALPKNEMMKFPLGGFVPAKHKRFVPAQDPKIWIAAGNCLIGDAYGNANSMVVTALSHYGYRQFVGYTVPSWFGRGWEIHSHFFSGTPAMQVGQAWLFCMENTLQNLPETLQKTEVPLQAQGMVGIDIRALAGTVAAAGSRPDKALIGNLHDRDTIVFYGDPICPVSFKRKPTTVELTANGRSRELTIKPAAGTEKAPIAYWFPERANVAGTLEIARVLISGTEQKITPEIIFTENFVILKNEHDFGNDSALKIKWQTK